MSNAFMGEMRWVSFNFAPKGWTLCNGQFMPINQNQALFSLLGTMYGGDGIRTFALPNLQGRSPVHAGPSVDPAWQPTPYDQGQITGAENVTLQLAQLPLHNHLANASTTAGSLKNPTNALYGGTGSEALYAQAGAPVALAPQTLTTVGSSGPHANMQPFRVLNFSIALTGFFPSRN